MTVAGGAVITPRMLDVLSSGGVADAQALAQGSYLKIRRISAAAIHWLIN